MLQHHWYCIKNTMKIIKNFSCLCVQLDIFLVTSFIDCNIDMYTGLYDHDRLWNRSCMKKLFILLQLQAVTGNRQLSIQLRNQRNAHQSELWTMTSTFEMYMSRNTLKGKDTSHMTESNKVSNFEQWKFFPLTNVAGINEGNSFDTSLWMKIVEGSKVYTHAELVTLLKQQCIAKGDAWGFCYNLSLTTLNTLSPTDRWETGSTTTMSTYNFSVGNKFNNTRYYTKLSSPDEWVPITFKTNSNSNLNNASVNNTTIHSNNGKMSNTNVFGDTGLLPGLYIAPGIYVPNGTECEECGLNPVILEYCPRCYHHIGSMRKQIKKQKLEKQQLEQQRGHAFSLSLHINDHDINNTNHDDYKDSKVKVKVTLVSEPQLAHHNSNDPIAGHDILENNYKITETKEMTEITETELHQTELNMDNNTIQQSNMTTMNEDEDQKTQSDKDDEKNQANDESTDYNIDSYKIGNPSSDVITALDTLVTDIDENEVKQVLDNQDDNDNDNTNDYAGATRVTVSQSNIAGSDRIRKTSAIEDPSYYNRVWRWTIQQWIWLQSHPTHMRAYKLVRRMLRTGLTWFDFVSDIIVMQILYTNPKYFAFFVAMIIGVISPYLISWAVSLRWVDKELRGKQRHWVQTFLASLLMFPPLGVALLFIGDMLWSFEDLMINPIRFLLTSRTRIEVCIVTKA